ncbi:hypothetical protein C5S35_03545 [Candidatus Methanophagaceae archaeon]|nr:hypothetical protein C5S35_03545 [Methanophagales archaeon]
MVNMENKENLKEYMLKEIEIIQDIIKRLDSHQFMLKGWAITLVVVTLLLKGNENQVLIAFIPLLVFWFLDAHFLRIERMYRKMYEWIISNRLKTNEHLLDMDAYRFEEEVESTPQVMVSITLRWFYGSIAVLIIIYALLLL